MRRKHVSFVRRERQEGRSHVIVFACNARFPSERTAVSRLTTVSEKTQQTKGRPVVMAQSTGGKALVDQVVGTLK